ncbi:MAG: quinolinate phosphoribosyl transferase [candidate division Zixibacteria bacterium]|nr:quinolinate phosphoribosyl transferase [candidate division Zixibacteria bacterium]
MRLDPSVFDLPVVELRRGYRSGVYFWRTKRILEQDNRHVRCLMQVFQKKEKAIVCGTDEAIAVLKTSSGYYKEAEAVYPLFDRYVELKKNIRQQLAAGDYDGYLKSTAERTELIRRMDDLWISKFSELEVRSLSDGEALGGWETALTIEGDLSYFAHLESVYLGVLARRTKVASNTRAVVEAALGKPVLFFADRFDHFAAQGGDGYASMIGGAKGVATDAMAAWYGDRGLGTMPHALIAAYDGNTVLATEKFARYIPDVPVISLVDFDNNCPATSVAVARKLGQKLWGVRLDTSETIIDYSLAAEIGGRSGEAEAKLRGVNPSLVLKVREALDKEGFQHVKIVVSGGFNPDKIKWFEESRVPVDSYAVGSWILTGSFDFTADVVLVEGKPAAKVGREYRPNTRLKKVEG